MNDKRIGPKSGIQACTGSSRGHPPQFVGVGDLPAGWYAARGDPPVPDGARGHPLLSFGPGVNLPVRFKARDHPESPTGARGHPESFKARDHPVMIRNNRINSSEDGLIITHQPAVWSRTGEVCPGGSRKKETSYGFRVSGCGFFIRQPADRLSTGSGLATGSCLAPLTFWEAVHNQWEDLPAVIEIKAVRLTEAIGQRTPGNPGLTASENRIKE